MKHKNPILLLSLLSLGLAGCSAMSDSIISCEMQVRNHVLAQKAWGHWSWCYDNLDFPFHFAKGFKDGYRNILSGGSGCQPTLPPKCYWKPAYQSPEGNCKIHAWFDGFSHGVLAANQDGYGSLGEIPISPTARANLEQARKLPVDDMFFAEEIENTESFTTPSSEATVRPPTAHSAMDGNIPTPSPAPPSDRPPVQLRPYE